MGVGGIGDADGSSGVDVCVLDGSVGEGVSAAVGLLQAVTSNRSTSINNRAFFITLIVADSDPAGESEVGQV